MEDTASPKRDISHGNVGRIIGLFENTRSNKNRGFQRTNFLTESPRHSGSSTDKDEEENTQTKELFSGLHRRNGRVQKIKDEIEQKSNKKGDIKTPSISQNKSKSRIGDSMSNIKEDLKSNRKTIRQNKINIRKPAEKIKIVTENQKKSDTRLEISFHEVKSINHNIFQYAKDHEIKAETGNCEADTINKECKTVTYLGDDKVDYGNYDLKTGNVVFSGSESGSNVENNNYFSRPKYNGKDRESNAPIITKYLLKGMKSYREFNDEFNEGKEHINKEAKRQKENKDLKMDSINWSKQKSSVQVIIKNKNFNKNKKTATKYSESSTSTLESGREFTTKQLTKRTHRRTGITVKSQTVKEIAKQFESFKDAAEKGETESFRKCLIDEIDKEMENMKKDGFQEDFYLSLENLAILDYQDGEDNCYDEDSKKPYNSDKGTNYFDEEKQDDEKTGFALGEAKASHSRLCLNNGNNETDLKRISTYPTTSEDTYYDRVEANEGIYTEKSLCSYGYNAANRETFCDEYGVVRIERNAADRDNVDDNPEYMNTNNHYYKADDNNEQDEEIYYESLRLEPEHPVYMNTNNYYDESEDNYKQEEDDENFYELIRLEQEVTVPVPEVKKETLKYIMEEIKTTERKYVDDLEKVVMIYAPFLRKKCPDKMLLVLGNMMDIFPQQLKFKKTLDNCEDDIKEAVQAFRNYEYLFILYPEYFANIPKANAAVKELSLILKEKQEQLNDKLHLSAYLLTPLQRLGKYKLFLENIIKQLKKEEKSTGAAEMALEIIEKYMSRGNDAVALASILDTPSHVKECGSFVAREIFSLLEPKRMELMVFLFKEVVIFTRPDQRNMDQFIYWQSIKTEDLRIATFNDTTIHLTDYTKTNRPSTSQHTFVLNAKTKNVKNAWKQEIEEILWTKLKKVKEDEFAFSRNSIQDCPFDINGYGSFLLKSEFIARKPKKMVIMVFLYEKMIILTQKQGNEDSFYYIGSIKMDQLNLLPPNKKYKNLLEIKDHVNSLKFHKDIIFRLEAPSEYILVEWRRAIEKCLWGQLLKAKAKGFS